MKNFIPLAILLVMAACSENKETETPKKVWVCDSIQESSFDSEGNEILTPKLFCDSVLQEQVKK
jgi:hypothetical protein